MTRSPQMAPLLLRARKAAEVSDITVLLEGETGTGKQILAQAIHSLDQKRKSFSFVTVHCSTISETLAESELFGHQRGAFSGAVSDRKGLFQAAQNGTILLDDVNDLPAGLQAKLLDVIQRGTVRPVGSDREIRVNARLIAAANQPLEPLVRAGSFRADLYHRLNVVKLSLLPLRERKEDLSSLILALARRHGSLYGPMLEVETGLLDFLAEEPFPGNIRELENAVQRMLFLKTGGTSFTLCDWVAQSQNEQVGQVPGDLLAKAASALWLAISQRGMSWDEAFQEIERRVLQSAMNLDGCTRREIAERLQTSERTLYHKMRAYGLSRGSGLAEPASMTATFGSF
ncbi:MAG TPA: sigma 54-interacting transcriptional regulator [Candidatus Sulfopaludibacter sp.]|nr:sigma 54-interacting transcriptional regulator [Candidatus Sulfopaludibacter sp.]